MTDLAARYRGLRVLVTGHTGFKGSWLASWLKRDGAVVAGIALAPEHGRPNLFEVADVAQGMHSTLGDIRDYATVQQCFAAFRPDVVFHLAAQALVRRSYVDPVGTFASNVMGTVHVLEAARCHPGVRAVVVVTTDKVYENREWAWGYRENDRLGGKDAYSASKAAAELAAAAYRDRLLPLAGDVAVATARGGNVIGGGDWSEDRLVPDAVMALLSGADLTLRNPSAVRPWQHVLELCRGYLQLGALLLDSPAAALGAWNFGPERENEVEVGKLVTDFFEAWGPAKSRVRVEGSNLKEAGQLRLDHSRARHGLGWQPLLGYAETLSWTADWYRRYHVSGESAGALVDAQIERYVQLCPSSST